MRPSRRRRTSPETSPSLWPVVRVSVRPPGALTVDWLDRPTQVLHAAAPYLGEGARAASRIPTGHPEGFIEAFANLYRDMADAIAEGRATAAPVPGIEEGVRAMAFVETAVAASRDGRGWVDLEAAA